ncbi:MAG: hypothetical protein CRN43_08350 [Candidatus Nephrothrix sp. EaCA]|nr:MAG: hypothetical protein CRN43_08350 [Candidatus Nephrothrix sp. EaCA]
MQRKRFAARLANFLLNILFLLHFIAKNQAKKPKKFEIEPDFYFNFMEIVCFSPPCKPRENPTAPFPFCQKTEPSAREENERTTPFNGIRNKSASRRP